MVDDSKFRKYLQSHDLTLQEKQLLFRFCTFTYDCKANLHQRFQNDQNCTLCTVEDTQEHVVDCEMLTDNVTTDLKYNQIFGSIKKQVKIIKHLVKVDCCRKLSFTDGSQVHCDSYLIGA